MDLEILGGSNESSPSEREVADETSTEESACGPDSVPSDGQHGTKSATHLDFRLANDAGSYFPCSLNRDGKCGALRRILLYSICFTARSHEFAYGDEADSSLAA